MRAFIALILASVAAPALAAPDLAMVARITDEGMNRGEVVETVAYLTDRIGPRMTNSPGMRVAERWTQDRFRAWGLTNVRTEGFDFGRGWSIDSASVTLESPRRMSLRTIPVAWTPATPAGGITAPLIVAPMKRPRDFAERLRRDRRCRAANCATCIGWCSQSWFSNPVHTVRCRFSAPSGRCHG